MARSFSELTPSEKIHFEDIVRFMKETWNEDLDNKLKVVKKFNLDVKDPVVFDFLTDIYVPALPSDTSEQLLSTSVTETTKPVETIKKREMTYANSEDLIVMQNRLLHAISHLTLNERRLILFLSPIVRKGSSVLDEKGREIFIVKFSDFAEEYGLNKKNSVYNILKETSESIVNKGFFYWHIKKNKRRSRVGLSWFTKCEYQENSGYLEIVLSDEIIEMLTVFDKSTKNSWTKYQKEWITHLGTYGIIMLELVLSSVDKEVKGYYTIEHLREKFNCNDTYPMFSDFKIWVIDKAIEQIERYTPIRIKYERHKTGRAVTGLTFSYIDTSAKPITDQTNQDQSNNQPKEQNPFVNFKMTQKQLSLFASKIKKASGQDVEEIIAELSNVHLQSKHIDFLKVLDYVPSDWYSDDEIKNHLTAEQIAQAQADKKAQAKVQEQQRQEQFRADMDKLVAHAETFVKANLSRVGKAGIERIYLQQENYAGIVRAWERHLLDEKTRKHFAMLDEILAV